MTRESFNDGLNRYLTPEQRRKIAAVTVGIAGAGGLGSNCAHHLVRTGFTRLVIADADTVEPSNLNRQFYFADQVGVSKVRALKDNLLRINAAVSVRAIPLHLDDTNIGKVFDGCGIVVEAFDDPAAKAMLISSMLPAGKKVVAAAGLAGYGNTDEITTRRTGAGLVLIGDGKREAGTADPPLAPRVNVAAAKQADAVLEMVLDG